MDFNDDEDEKGFNYELKMDFEYLHNLNIRDLDYGLILRMSMNNQIMFLMKTKEAIFITIENLRFVDRAHTTQYFGSWVDHWEYDIRVKNYKGSRVDVKHKSIKDKVRHEVFDIDEALHIEYSKDTSFQVRGIHVEESKVTMVRDWSLPKTLPEVRNNKVVDAFQEENELDYAEPLDGEAKQVTYDMICFIIIDGRSYENLMSKALVKAFKLPTEPHHSPYQIGWIKKGPTLEMTEICKVSLAIEKYYNELVTCDVVNIDASQVLLGRPWQHDMYATYQENKTLVTLVASPKEIQAKRKETWVFYAYVVKGVEEVMENALPTVIKPLLAEFGKIVTDDTPDALPPLRNIQHQIDFSRKTTLLVSISNKVLVSIQLRSCTQMKKILVTFG
nr:putative nucleotidyltransferase, ribonuclease H [Tanacetum cinerariifolium]